MAEQFTEAGQFGKNLRSGLVSAYKAANDFFTEYGQEPLLNLYPQAVNLTAAAGEAAAGAFNYPVSLGRYPYYDLPTRFDKKAEQPEAAEVSEEVDDETPTITISKKANPSKLWRVMTEGGDRTKDRFFDSEEEAYAELKSSGGKGIVMGLTIPKENQAALKNQYIQNVRENWGAGKKAVDKPEQPTTEAEFLRQQITRLNPNATEEQKRNYVERLSASRAKRREREGYADEYAAQLAKGTLPTEYEQRRMKEKVDARNMRDFIARTRVVEEQAKQDEREYSDQMRYLKAYEREARRSKDYGAALTAKNAMNNLNKSLNITSNDRSKRMNIFRDIATQELDDQIKERDRVRREALQRSITANPEVG